MMMEHGESRLGDILALAPFYNALFGCFVVILSRIVTPHY